MLAEVLTLRDAMEWASNMGWKAVIFEGDAKQVIDVVNGISPVLAYIEVVVQDIMDLRKQFDSCKFCFVHRQANSVAHVLARHLLNRDCPVE